MQSKTIICQPSSFDQEFIKWFAEATEEYRNTVMKEKFYCDIKYFGITILHIQHDNIAHYILYEGNNANGMNKRVFYD